MTTTSLGSATPLGEPPIPPLREGDRMDRFEFERRWSAMPEPRPKAELLEGEVHFMSPIYEDSHSIPQADFGHLLTTYRLATPGVIAGGPGSLRLNHPNMPEPDGNLRISEACGGQSRRASDGCIEGAPELVVEIVGSTARKDLGVKFGIYRRQGVREYVVWRTGRNVMDWFIREDDRFDPLYPDQDGVVRSQAFPGLWADTHALIRGDLAAAVTTLQLGLASLEHEAFAAKLRDAAPRTQG